MELICPNCFGELVPRPRRPKASRPFTLVQANLGQLDVTASLFDEYRQFYGQISDIEGARTFLHDRLSNRESVVFLAKSLDGFLGFVQLYPSFTSVGMRRGWILNDLFVKASGRRRGVATALIERARALAQSTDAAWLKLETANTNASAQALYSRLGFEREEGFASYTLRL